MAIKVSAVTASATSPAKVTLISIQPKVQTTPIGIDREPVTTNVQLLKLPPYGVDPNVIAGGELVSAKLNLHVQNTSRLDSACQPLDNSTCQLPGTEGT
jgi:hypothetical protein